MSDINIQAISLITISLLVFGFSIMFIMRYLKKDQAISHVDRFFKEGNYRRALAVSFKLANMNPNDYTHKYNIGRAYEGLKNYQQAIEYYEMASIAADNTSKQNVQIMILLKIAELYRTIKKYNEALGYYVMVLDKDHYNVHALKTGSKLLFEMKNFSKSKEYIETLLKMKQDDVESRFLLARIYLNLSQMQNSAQQLDYILHNIKVDKTGLIPRASLMLADINFQMKNYGRSIEVLKGLMDYKDYFETVIEKLINNYIKTKNISLAVDLANRFFSRVSKEKQCILLYLIATACFMDADYYKAVKTWEKAYYLNNTYKDLKDLMNTYAYIIHNPKTESYFSKSDAAFETVSLKILKKTYVKQIIRNERFWAYETKDSAYVFYRRPFPVTLSELMEIQRVVSQSFRVNSIFVLYSLFGVTEDTKIGKSKMGPQKIDMISESTFIEQLNAV